MTDWLSKFNYDPTKSLLESGNETIIYFTKKNLLEEDVNPIECLWNLSEVQKIVKKQVEDGSWPINGKYAVSGVKYPLIETWKQIRILIQQYELNNTHPSIRKVAEFIFSCQTTEGDIRGILANQYTPYYTGAIMYLLIKAGYQNDPRIEKGFKWLLKMRQDDGGWVIGSPGMIGLSDLTRAEMNDLTSNKNRETAQAFDRSKPFSAAGTGMVLRAFSVHPTYKKSEAALTAERLLKSKFFKKDNWTSYQHPDNWLRFQYPFWWTNLVSALDSLSLMGFSKEDNDVEKALKWFIDHQEPDGLWKVSYSKIHKSPDDQKTFKSKLWITLAICRIFKRFTEC
ncbi:prenyltransferase/squalene oxidase repeat-containing protein [Methanobacterium petrolearium]|uniref:prenyltransferase/squalene oxidase repeat-containing protein n=1 Tax=Methanobacterium petrolearium TaxID=710190 RepID=UPI001AE21B21|nr:prenyltransferase/squalene oxidase repeat-containing protein [Methanobacterium petrolearium]MBP1946537.1 hypothetical protein [Methanobacterium petrolearium]BDZ69882.1 hypothetical protein GCM10025861_03990 [Methanobacterium petrolearium]